jgi:hypothetical protein
MIQVFMLEKIKKNIYVLILHFKNISSIFAVRKIRRNKRAGLNIKYFNNKKWQIINLH